MLKKCTDREGMPLIAAHRGAAGGNVPCNTLTAYDAAISQGADIVELDISQSRDGVLFAFHPGMEPHHLKSSRLIREMDAADVTNLRYHNSDGVQTQYGVSRFDDVLEHLKGRCVINIDKFWTCMWEIAAAVRSHGMVEQVLIKTGPDTAYFRAIEEIAPDFAYMVMARGEDVCTPTLARRALNYVGVEALFNREDCPVCGVEYIDRMHRAGLIVWANAIVYDYQDVIGAGHTDDVSVGGDPGDGWGWLADRGFDVIQTDWPLALSNYLRGLHGGVQGVKA